MKKMKTNDLVQELNDWASYAENQSEENLCQLYFHYVNMFQQYCGVVPNFELIDNRGSLKLIEPEFK
jgi:hypothetical protein